MKVNHDKTRSLILDITKLIEGQGTAANNYRTEEHKVLEDTTYSQEYKEERLVKLRAAYTEKLNDTKTKLVEKLNTVLDAELENENTLEFDIPEFANTLASINAIKGNLPGDVIESIRKNFTGHYQVLQTLVAAFEGYGIDVKEKYGYAEYIHSASIEIPSLIDKAENIEYDALSTLWSLKQFYKDVIHFGEVRGIAFSDSEKTFEAGENADIDDAIARQTMGVPEVGKLSYAATL